MNLPGVSNVDNMAQAVDVTHTLADILHTIDAIRPAAEEIRHSVAIFMPLTFVRHLDDESLQAFVPLIDNAIARGWRASSLDVTQPEPGVILRFDKEPQP